MAYVLGVDLGTTYTAAAVYRDGQVRIAELGNRSAVIPSVVLVKEDESVLTGEAATRRAISEPERVAREFKRRLGDPTPLLLGGRPYSSEQLQAKLLRWVVGHVTEREGAAPDRIAITHPANWGPFKLDLFTQALRLADLEDVVTLTEPQAAAIHYASQERVDPGTLVAVYDLGGGTFDAAVLRKTERGFDILGAPEGIERLGGIDFDEAVFAHVVRSLGGAVEELDPDDPAARAAVARLRHDCIEAKEALSGDTEASIPVVLPSVSTEVRLTRAEFESLIRPPLTDTLEAMRRALRSADVTPADLTAILLVGGSSRIPLVAQMVGAELGRPVAVDAHPKHGVAMGAALAAADALASSPGTAAVALIPEPTTPDVVAPEPAAEVVAAGAAAEAMPEAIPEPMPEPMVEPMPMPEPAVERDEPVLAGVGGPAAPARSKWPVVAGVAALVVIAGFFLRPGGGGREPDITGTQGTGTDNGGVIDRTDAPTDDTTTASPTPTPSATPSPTPTLDPNSAEARGITDPDEVLWLTLTDVVRNAAGQFEVTYETSNYEALIGNGIAHVHFYWPLWDPSTVGSGGGAGADWAAWPPASGPANAPLAADQYSVATLPEGITQICAIVANNDHTVHEPATAQERGHCIDLPTEAGG